MIHDRFFSHQVHVFYSPVSCMFSSALVITGYLVWPMPKEPSTNCYSTTYIIASKVFMISVKRERETERQRETEVIAKIKAQVSLFCFQN